MKIPAILLLFMACPLFAQIGGTTQTVAIYDPGDGLPDVIPVRLSCPDGFKTQRYHAARPGNMGAMSARIPEDYGDPAGWDDIDAAKPQDGDYRCVRIKSEHAQAK